ncbi:hypothetical protein Agub_g8192, partial [Astrephomene gubernaculifera]
MLSLVESLVSVVEHSLVWEPAQPVSAAFALILQAVGAGHGTSRSSVVDVLAESAAVAIIRQFACFPQDVVPEVVLEELVQWSAWGSLPASSFCAAGGPQQRSQFSFQSPSAGIGGSGGNAGAHGDTLRGGSAAAGAGGSFHRRAVSLGSAGNVGHGGLMGFGMSRVVPLDVMVVFVALVGSGSLEERAHAAFWTLDRDGAGYLTLAQLLRLSGLLAAVAAAGRLLLRLPPLPRPKQPGLPPPQLQRSEGTDGGIAGGSASGAVGTGDSGDPRVGRAMLDAALERAFWEHCLPGDSQRGLQARLTADRLALVVQSVATHLTMAVVQHATTGTALAVHPHDAPASATRHGPQPQPQQQQPQLRGDSAGATSAAGAEGGKVAAAIGSLHSRHSSGGAGSNTAATSQVLAGSNSRHHVSHGPTAHAHGHGHIQVHLKHHLHGNTHHHLQNHSQHRHQRQNSASAASAGPEDCCELPRALGNSGASVFSQQEQQQQEQARQEQAQPNSSPNNNNDTLQEPSLSFAIDLPPLPQPPSHQHLQQPVDAFLVPAGAMTGSAGGGPVPSTAFAVTTTPAGYHYPHAGRVLEAIPGSAGGSQEQQMPSGWSTMAGPYSVASAVATGASWLLSWPAALLASRQQPPEQEQQPHLHPADGTHQGQEKDALVGRPVRGPGLLWGLATSVGGALLGFGTRQPPQQPLLPGLQEQQQQRAHVEVAVAADAACAAGEGGGLAPAAVAASDKARDSNTATAHSQQGSRTAIAAGSAAEERAAVLGSSNSYAFFNPVVGAEVGFESAAARAAAAEGGGGGGSGEDQPKEQVGGAASAAASAERVSPVFGANSAPDLARGSPASIVAGGVTSGGAAEATGDGSSKGGVVTHGSAQGTEGGGGASSSAFTRSITGLTQGLKRWRRMSTAVNIAGGHDSSNVSGQNVRQDDGRTTGRGNGNGSSVSVELSPAPEGLMDRGGTNRGLSSAFMIAGRTTPTLYSLAASATAASAVAGGNGGGYGGAATGGSGGDASGQPPHQQQQQPSLLQQYSSNVTGSDDQQRTLHATHNHLHGWQNLEEAAARAEAAAKAEAAAVAS